MSKTLGLRISRRSHKVWKDTQGGDLFNYMEYFKSDVHLKRTSQWYRYGLVGNGWDRRMEIPRFYLPHCLGKSKYYYIR